LQTYYYGLDRVFVERGQPVLTQDTLGEVESGGTLKFLVLRGGRPQDPSQYFN
jgi:murein DD-endopeptidase MepM/ murein hydrolase activator NlpD